jgi:hypothetical protein
MGHILFKVFPNTCKQSTQPGDNVTCTTAWKEAPWQVMQYCKVRLGRNGSALTVADSESDTTLPPFSQPISVHKGDQRQRTAN